MIDKYVTYCSALCLVAAVSTAPSVAGEFPADSLMVMKPQLSAEMADKIQHADVAAGEKYFMRKCIVCHDGERDGQHNTGPLLWNIMGRVSGRAEGFEYSDAMKATNHVWDFSTLDYYLTRVQRAIPGTAMNFRGIKKVEDRANLLAYLRALHDAPPALPE